MCWCVHCNLQHLQLNRQRIRKWINNYMTNVTSEQWKFRFLAFLLNYLNCSLKYLTYILFQVVHHNYQMCEHWAVCICQGQDTFKTIFTDLPSIQQNPHVNESVIESLLLCVLFPVSGISFESVLSLWSVKIVQEMS